MAVTVLNETLWLLRERGWGGRGSGSSDHLVRDVRSGATTSRPVFIATHALDHN